MNEILCRKNHNLVIQKYCFYPLPTVKELQLDDCLQIAMQSLVTEVSGCVNNPLEVHSFSAHTTVVPEVFS